MIREGISVDLLKNIQFITSIVGEEGTLFSLDKGIALTIEYNTNTRLIKSIKINNVYVDVSMDNIRIINKVYANETNRMSLSITDPKDSYDGDTSSLIKRR